MAITVGIVAPLTGFSQSTTTNVNGTSGVLSTALPFLSINPDTRGGALGDAGVALSPTPNATFWNPASLAFAETHYGIALDVVPWLRYIVPDVNLVDVTGYVHLGEHKGVIGGSLTYFSQGSYELRDFINNKTGEYSPNEYAFAVSYALKVTPNLSASAQLRYIHSAIAGSNGASPPSAQSTPPPAIYPFTTPKTWEIKTLGAVSRPTSASVPISQT